MEIAKCKGSHAALLVLALSLTSCRRHFFAAQGYVTSVGNRINTWHSTPQGCTRDPFDGLPPVQTLSILTLLWEDPGMRDPLLDNLDTAPDAPMRLEFARSKLAGSPLIATLRTLRRPEIQLDENVCATFRLHTQEHAPSSVNGRPTLSGTLALDCRANGNHISAKVEFEQCTY